MNVAQASAATPYDYFSLLKPRVMSLVIFTGACGALLAPDSLHPFLLFIIVFTIALGSGAAGAINMWYERDIDKKMRRTQNRPMPRGVIESGNGLAFGVILALASIMILGLAVNWFAAFLLFVAIFYYVFIYTIWLKPRTPQNIVIGGAAGAFPPVIGWAGVMGSTSVEPWLMFALIFFWTPPHFWALALVKNDDYQNANIPMLPVIRGAHYTKIQILFYGLLLLPISLAFFYPFGFAGKLYALGALILSLEFLRRILVLLFDQDNKTAIPTFYYSIFYLFLLFVLLICDRFLTLLF